MLPGVNELILTVVIIFLLFGATKVPKVVKYTGKTMYEYKKGQNEGKEGLNQIEKRIKELEQQDTGKNALFKLASLNPHLSNVKKEVVNRKYALMVLGLLIVATGVLLMLEGKFWGDI